MYQRLNTDKVSVSKYRRLFAIKLLAITAEDEDNNVLLYSEQNYSEEVPAKWD